LESADVKIDEFVERNDVECKIKLEYYSTIINMNDGAPNTVTK
jgi:hypothetical protein